MDSGYNYNTPYGPYNNSAQGSNVPTQQGGGMSTQGLGSLMQFIPGFMNLMKGMNNSGQKQTAAQLSNVTNAMGNPNNPLYQQLYGGFKQQGQQQLGQNITQMEGQNRNLSAMGRTPLFAPERNGEMAFRAQAAAGPQMGMMAQQQTQQALQNQAHALNPYGQQGSYNNLQQSQYGPRAAMGAANSSSLGLGGLGAFMNTGGQGAMSQGVNAPGAQQGNNSLLGMLSGGY